MSIMVIYMPVAFQWPFLQKEVQATYQQIEKECSVMINKASKAVTMWQILHYHLAEIPKKLYPMTMHESPFI